VTDLCDYEVSVLRCMNGEDVDGLVAGAAMWVAASRLKGLGYAAGHYHITDKGKACLAALTSPSREGRG